MQQQQSDESKLVMAALAGVGMMIIIMAAIIFAVAAFATLILTIMCIIAWNEPLTIGRMTIMPDAARAFIARGIVCAILLPVFMLFSRELLDLRIPPNWWGYIVLVGYMAGTLGGEYVINKMKEEEEQEQDILMPPHQPSRAPPEEPRRPFEYASWDDEA